MYANLLTGLLATLALSPAAASPIEASPIEARYSYPSCVDQFFYLKGNATGLPTVDGKYLGTRPVANTYVGFGLPYGQKVTKFGYDSTAGTLYTGFTSTGEPLLLSGIITNGTAAFKAAPQGYPGAQPIECTVLADTLLCGAIFKGMNYNKIVLEDYNGDGHYEVALSAVFATAVQLLAVSSDK